MNDLSNLVASHVLCRNGRSEHDTQRTLLFRPRAGWTGAVAFGSWGLVIAVPLTGFALSGGLPPGSAGVVLALSFVGYALLYAAARSLVNGARLERESGELRLSFGPLWPRRARSWRLADVRATAIGLRPPSFWHPATLRGFPVAQPFRVELCLADGTRARLPLTLGLRDAEVVARFVDEQL